MLPTWAELGTVILKAKVKRAVHPLKLSTHFKDNLLFLYFSLKETYFWRAYQRNILINEHLNNENDKNENECNFFQKKRAVHSLKLSTYF